MTATTSIRPNIPAPSAAGVPNGERLLEVRDLSKEFILEKKRLFGKPAKIFTAVDRVSFDVYRGETFGIVGESGSGKTTAVRCILRALSPSGGTVRFSNQGRTVDLSSMAEGQLKPLRKEMQMIFQDPYASLNPRMTVGDIVGEPLLIHRMGKPRERKGRVIEMLERVGLLAEHMHRYPHAFSGGQRQRIGIARAHNLAVVRTFCSRVAVMYRGRIMELGACEQVLVHPRHAYTKVLLSAVPRPDPDFKMQPLSVTDLTPEELVPCD
jgi:ABC-type oligopeptide transport system ATPase subunit